MEVGFPAGDPAGEVADDTVIPVAIPRQLPRLLTSLDLRLTHCRAGERVVLFFFLHTAVLCFVHGLPLQQKLMAVTVPLVLFSFWCAETRWSRKSTDVARDWIVPAAVLGGYWQMGWFAGPYDFGRQQVWLSWDRLLLDGWGLRHLVEQQLTGLPWCLELSYLLLYAIPVTGVSVIYLRRSRVHIDRFLATFALGTLTAYALLPMIAVQSPRIAFPGRDLPHVDSIWRSANIWILSHFDISTSVFPSGHVAVAFSSAFGLKRAVPDSSRPFWAFLGVAVMVYVATIYGRYHYAVDGLASIVICLAAWRLCERLDRETF